LLDTTVLIDCLRDAPAAAKVEALLERGDVACTTAINIEELARGLRPREHKHAQALAAGLVVIPLGASEGWQAGTWRQAFASNGMTLAQADCLIAAATLSADAVLATGNPKDFPMTEISVEHWPTGR
jgi:predicted nucleic acid-binding protein